MSTATRFTEADLAAIDAALTQLEQRFSRLVALDAKERRRLYKMGNKTEKFCRETLNVLDKNRQLVNPATDLNGALSALRTIDELRPRTRQILRLAERMRDTELALGADVATAARRGYKEMGEHGDQHGLTGLRQTLSVRFKKRPAANDGGNEQGAA
jgi:type II secretory pathway component PulJ